MSLNSQHTVKIFLSSQNRRCVIFIFMKDIILTRLQYWMRSYSLLLPQMCRIVSIAWQSQSEFSFSFAQIGEDWRLMEFHTWRRRIDTAVMWKHGLQLLCQKLLVPDQSKKCKPRFEKLDSILNVLRARLERKYNCWIKWLNKQTHLCSVCPQCYMFALGLGTPESWVSSLSFE